MSELRDIFAEVERERTAQDRQWGGPAHDDEHEAPDWLDYIEHQGEAIVVAWELGNSTEFGTTGPSNAQEIHDRFIKIIALGVAGLQSHERKANAQRREEGGR